MKLSFCGIFLQCLFVNLLLATEINAQKALSVKEVYLDLELKQASLVEVFSLIESKTDYKFNYSKVDINRALALNKNYKNASVAQILTDISREARLNFKQVNLGINVDRAPRRSRASVEVITFETISGKVSDETNQGIPGVNIVIKGTNSGAVTDIDGNYSINVPNEESILVYSAVGYISQEVVVGSRTTINITMLADIRQLEELVVTAFGLEREKKELTYSTQNVKLGAISEARPNQDVINGLQGKVAGLSINTSSGGVSGESRVVLRGERSTSGNSEPLYIIDGVVASGGLSDISADDIESISVLKGANAAALYGNRAQNGAVIVSTKKGRDGFNIDINQTFTAEKALVLHSYQNQFGQGSAGTYVPASTFSWGPSLNGSQVANWSPDPALAGSTIPYTAYSDNVKDFYQTGKSLSTSVAISAGGEKGTTYFSYTFDDKEGVIPNNELTRHNFNLRVENKLTDKLTFNGKVNFIRSQVSNQLATGEAFDNPNRHAYRLPRNVSNAQASAFEYIDAAGNARQNFWLPLDNGGANPYWTVNRNLNDIIDDRVLGFASLEYEIVDGLKLLARSAIDRTNIFRENRWHNDTYIIAQTGNYSINSSQSYEWNHEFLAQYAGESGEFTYNINVGGNLRQERRNGVSTNNGGLNVPNLFAIGNAQNLTASETIFRRDVNSLYGFGQIGWKGALFLDATWRGDWSSTLPSPHRFTYPSFGLSAVLSDLVSLPEIISFAKLRVNYAESGGDTSPFRLSRLVTASGGFLTLGGLLPLDNLKPERTKSIDVGFDLRLFEDRLGIDFTYYKTNTNDQIFTENLAIGANASQRLLNGGDIENKGIELVLTGTPLQTSDFTWDITVNYSKNTSEVKELFGQSDVFNLGAPNGSGFLGTNRLDLGEPFGNIVSRGFERDSQGRVLVDPNTGVPLRTAGLTEIIGNYNPDWLGGIFNSFQYKNFSATFLIDIRQGGNLVSFTDAILAADGLTEITAQGRDGTLVFGQNIFGGETAVLADADGNGTETPNNVSVNAETLWTALGGRNSPTGEAFVRDASNVRMREIALGYELPASVLSKTPFKRVKFSLVGRNLFFLSNKAEILDPDVISSANVAAVGFENFAPPTSRSFGFNIKLGL
ncbi:SusC/RagA family TonB-linked outer membrane protein [Fulvivirgaceae bacterium BMA10]|uniref:SusC/RagA family TonB-linked outer membrane protein n=1 Tax=Splendidivirga corallicola TaxID=3051826 RepID=A0ABT8KHY0_9BACT|nr:SusC/RagA family TonB-linked outer membrane protein [Fulvivirgaceae bacterium BMA10]